MIRHAVSIAIAATSSLAPVAALADERLVQRSQGLDRGTRWERKAAIPVEFPTFHPQGFAAVGDALFVSSVEIMAPTQRLDPPRDGYDRTPGKGKGHLFKMSRAGKLLARSELGEGDAYHPGGIDFDGRWLWVPVAEYRPNSASIVYRVDPSSLRAEPVLRVRDHIGGVVRDTDANRLHGVSWGSRRFYAWRLDDALGPLDADEPLDALRTPNPSHYVDYQDCSYVGGHRMLCSGVSEYRPDPSEPKWSLGGIDLIDLVAGRPLYRVPILLWAESGEAMTRNPVLVESTEGGLRALFMPDDERSTLYVYEARLP